MEQSYQSLMNNFAKACAEVVKVDENDPLQLLRVLYEVNNRALQLKWNMSTCHGWTVAYDAHYNMISLRHPTEKRLIEITSKDRWGNEWQFYYSTDLILTQEELEYEYYPKDNEEYEALFNELRVIGPDKWLEKHFNKFN